MPRNHHRRSRQLRSPRVMARRRWGNRLRGRRSNMYSPWSREPSGFQWYETELRSA